MYTYHFKTQLEELGESQNLKKFNHKNVLVTFKTRQDKTRQDKTRQDKTRQNNLQSQHMYFQSHIDHQYKNNSKHEWASISLVVYSCLVYLSTSSTGTSSSMFGCGSAKRLGTSTKAMQRALMKRVVNGSASLENQDLDDGCKFRKQLTSGFCSS